LEFDAQHPVSEDVNVPSVSNRGNSDKLDVTTVQPVVRPVFISCESESSGGRRINNIIASNNLVDEESAIEIIVLDVAGKASELNILEDGGGRIERSLVERESEIPSRSKGHARIQHQEGAKSSFHLYLII